MTREDAFEIWLPIIKMGVKSMPECYEAIEIAITALKQEPCTDAISRQAVLEKAICVPIARVVTDDKVIYRKIVFVDEIENIPSVTAEKVGQWIDADVLDKIRAEIIKYEDDCRLSVDEYPSCKQCTDNTFETIYAILDKYKAESKGGTQHDD